MERITIVETVRKLLRAALLEDEDLIAGVQQERPVEVEGQPGLYRCACAVAVRRPLDPETAEIRQLLVSLRRLEEGWEVFRVEGLEQDAEEI